MIGAELSLPHRAVVPSVTVIARFAARKERLANEDRYSMCRACDMDAPASDDTGWESLDFIGTWQNGASWGKMGTLANEKAR